MVTFVKNCYQPAASLFVVGGQEFRPKERQKNDLYNKYNKLNYNITLDILIAIAGNSCIR